MEKIIEFFTDPLRLTLLVAGLAVLLGIIIFGRRSQRMDAKLYHGHSHREHNFNHQHPDLLVDEEIIVLPPRSQKVKTDEMDEVKVESFSPTEENVADTDVSESAKLGDEVPMATFEYSGKEKTTTESPVAASEPAAKVEQTETAQPQKPAVKEKPAEERFIVFHLLPMTKRTFNGKDLTQVATALGLAFGKHGVFHFPADSAREGNSQFCLVNMTSEGNFDRDTLGTTELRGVSLILRLSAETHDGLALFSNMLAIAQGLARRLGGEIQDQARTPLTPQIVTNLRSDIAKFHTQLNQRTPVTEI